MATSFGNIQLFTGKSKTEPKMLSPNLGDAFQGFNKLQPNLKSNDMQDQAVSEQRGLRERLGTLLDQQGQGERARIDDAFQTAANNATGGLASRGFAGSSLNIPAQLGVERERNMAHMQLNDSLLGQRMGMEQDVGKNISDLMFGSSEQATNLQSALLGAQGIGNFSESTNPPSAGAGGTGGSTTKDPVDGGSSFQDWASQNSPSQPSFRDSAGGAGGGGSGGGGGSPQAISNPFMAGEGGGDPSQMSDEELATPIPNRGPIQTPDAYIAELERMAEKKKRDEAKAAEAAAAMAAFKGAGSDPQTGSGDMSGGPSGMMGI